MSPYLTKLPSPSFLCQLYRDLDLLSPKFEAAFDSASADARCELCSLLKDLFMHEQLTAPRKIFRRGFELHSRGSRATDPDSGLRLRYVTCQPSIGMTSAQS